MTGPVRVEEVRVILDGHMTKAEAEKVIRVINEVLQHNARSIRSDAVDWVKRNLFYQVSIGICMGVGVSVLVAAFATMDGTFCQ